MNYITRKLAPLAVASFTLALGGCAVDGASSAELSDTELGTDELVGQGTMRLTAASAGGAGVTKRYTTSGRGRAQVPTSRTTTSLANALWLQVSNPTAKDAVVTMNLRLRGDNPVTAAAYETKRGAISAPLAYESLGETRDIQETDGSWTYNENGTRTGSLYFRVGYSVKLTVVVPAHGSSTALFGVRDYVGALDLFSKTEFVD